MIWPFSVDSSGYGQLHLNPPSFRVHVLACTGWHGPKPFPDADAAHGPCHNRRCWNGQHLSWKTRAENIADQLRDGTRAMGETHAFSRLTEADVLAIRELAATTTLS